MTDEQKRERRIARIAWFGVWLIRLLGLTWRVRVKNDAEFRHKRAVHEPFIFTLWHGQLLPLLYHHRGHGVAILISEHGDGEIIARIALRLGFRTVRGSTSRGAARALLGLVRELEDGHDIAITPDGPRGPAKSVAPGTLVVAQRGRAPILPIVAVASSAWHLKSWDSFMIPKPFTRVTVGYGPMIYVDAESARKAAEGGESLRRAMDEAEEMTADD
jgi:lysophospholipid acyltransferase (LPLAT)-like uncharacterized protein